MASAKRITRRGREIRDFILHQVPAHSSDIVKNTADHFGVTPQAINRHMRNLISEKLVVALGETNSRRYFLARRLQAKYEYPLEGLEEDKVWSGELQKFFRRTPANVYDIWEYGVTEMVNNAIDHSAGSKLEIKLCTTAISAIIGISDDGIGIFRKIKEAIGLNDEKDALLELAKGKFTTDPDNHSGEGIFFTSRCFDLFNIFSGNIFFNHDEHFDDEHWIGDTEEPIRGTEVILKLNNDSERQLTEVFDQYTSEEADFAFQKTVVPVRLLRQGHENLVSRSQAKRLMTRVEKFRTVVLDFSGVEQIGQAFADEVFRVFSSRHPEIELIPINENSRVSKMIKRALGRKS